MTWLSGNQPPLKLKYFNRVPPDAVAAASDQCFGEGGVEVYNLPQFYHNFSVMSPFKNFNFSLGKNCSVSALSLGTLYVYVFSNVVHVICVAGRFYFLCSQNVVYFWV